MRQHSLTPFAQTEKSILVSRKNLETVEDSKKVN